MPDITVENIVASTSFAEKLYLDAIAQSLEEAEYKPEQFPGLVYTGALKTEYVSTAFQKLSDELTSLDLIKK